MWANIKKLDALTSKVSECASRPTGKEIYNPVMRD
jgi:hypothetical protein